MFKAILAVMSIILAIVSLCTACVRRKTGDTNTYLLLAALFIANAALIAP